MTTDNIGQNIDFLYDTKIAKAALNKQIKDLDEATAEVERDLVRQIQEQGVNGLFSNRASATISEEAYASIEDYEAFEAYMKETDSLFLLQRRISQAAYNDLKAAGETIPGVKDFTKTKLSLRKR